MKNGLPIQGRKNRIAQEHLQKILHLHSFKGTNRVQT